MYIYIYNIYILKDLNEKISDSLSLSGHYTIHLIELDF